MIASKIQIYGTNISIWIPVLGIFHKTGIIHQRQEGEKTAEKQKEIGIIRLYLHRLSKRPPARLAVQSDNAAVVRVELARQVRLVRQDVVVARQEVGAHLPRKQKTQARVRRKKKPA